MLDTAITSAGLDSNLYHFWNVSIIDMGHMIGLEWPRLSLKHVLKLLMQATFLFRSK